MVLLAAEFTIQLYKYFGFNIEATDIARRVATKDVYTLGCILKHEKLPQSEMTDIFDAKRGNTYEKYTINQWLLPLVHIGIVECVRMEFAPDSFNNTYKLIGMKNYSNTIAYINTNTFSYADLYIHLWENAYGSLLTSGIELQKMIKLCNEQKKMIDRLKKQLRM